MIKLSIFCFVLTAGVLKSSVVSAGSCRESKLCCPGRDSSCVVQKAPVNSIIEDLSDKPCYCDHACLKLGDCCPDFKDVCGVVDCMVSEWGAWSSCSNACGAGTESRSRRVLRAPQHGGKRCPGLLQQRGCYGADCETAMLLPESLSYSRRVNASEDIRKNLRMRNPDDPTSNSQKEYCVEFEVLKASKSCKKELEYKSLHEGSRVCVRCEQEALRRNLSWRCQGAGVEGRSSRFSALAAPRCRGKWRRVTRDVSSDQCSSTLCNTANFIFV